MIRIENSIREKIRRIPGFFRLNIMIGAVMLMMAVGVFSPSVAKAQIQVQVQLALPSWAPYYDNTSRVRYYYFPDIECFYDVWNHEFVYSRDGYWNFGPTLPPEDSWYDLNTAFVVVLHQDVYEPWNHFHYYLTHYPRYYYRNYYRSEFGDRDRHPRGFNEGSRGLMYDRLDRDRPGNNRLPEMRRDNNEQNRPGYNPRQENRGNNMQQYPQDRRPGQESSRSAQPMQYHNRQIGHPVKVRSDMRMPREEQNKRQERR